ncbi:hypothetical protein KJ980_04485 [Patescibacteria group bacterium]|nr:hypothetical protein [Patescibacteria group bacterium]MBU4098881.1 hypothetical protein [Patescibacteria group bacterium]
MDGGISHAVCNEALMRSFMVLSPFAENPDRKIGNECEDFLLRRDFTPNEVLE